MGGVMQCLRMRQARGEYDRCTQQGHKQHRHQRGRGFGGGLIQRGHFSLHTVTPDGFSVSLHGRSPGSRVDAASRLPSPSGASGVVEGHSPHTVAGAAEALGAKSWYALSPFSFQFGRFALIEHLAFPRGSSGQVWSSGNASFECLAATPEPVAAR